MPRSFPRLGRRRPTLRTQVVALLLVLLATVSSAVGIATDLALHSFLLGRLDNQLLQAGGRTAGSVGAGPDRPPADQQINGVPDLTRALRGQGPGTLVAQYSTSGALLAYISNDDGQPVPLTTRQLMGLAGLPVDGRPHTLPVDGADYRVVARRAPDGDLFVTGLPTAGVTATLVHLAVIELAVTGIALVLAALAALALVNVTLRPLRRIAATARRVSELPLDRGEVALGERVPAADTDHRTEVGQVGAALNSLLGTVSNALTARQASESKVRQFVADASHELRTPLAAIRGYAELSRRSPDPLPPDVAHALGRVESEAVRMTSLVEDLLLLARLDAGRPLEALPVDLSLLLVDTVGDAHAAGPDHIWRLDLPEEPVIVTGDVARLHQVLANLLSNARTHTPAGTTVTAQVSVGPDAVAVLAVRDDGPGVPPAILPTIFERFARADTSRSRTAGSTGLGLAIVTAVVQSHGGTVQVSSEPGRTTFLVHLPLAPSG